MVSSAMVTRKTATVGTFVVNFTIETMCFTCRSIRCARTSSSDVSEFSPPINTSCFTVLAIPCLTHYTIGHREKLNMHYHLTTNPSSPQSTYDMTTDYNKPDELLQTTRILDTNYRRHIVHFRSDHNTHQHTHTSNIIFTNIILMADKYNIPKGKMQSNCRLLPDHIVCKITQRNNMRRANTRGPALKLRLLPTYSTLNKTYGRNT